MELLLTRRTIIKSRLLPPYTRSLTSAYTHVWRQDHDVSFESEYAHWMQEWLSHCLLARFFCEQFVRLQSYPKNEYMMFLPCMPWRVCRGTLGNLGFRGPHASPLFVYFIMYENLILVSFFLFFILSNLLKNKTVEQKRSIIILL